MKKKFIGTQRFIFCLLVVASLKGELDNYCIRDGYTIRISPRQVDFQNNLESKMQDAVYVLAQKIALEKKFKKIIDMGCGSGYKLIKYFQNFETVGYDIEPNLGLAKKMYPQRRFELSDFTIIPGERVDLVLCVDVVEHLLDPNELMAWLAGVNSQIVVISTPDRAKRPKTEEMGPPHWDAHVREWNFQEFETYVGRWFYILDHFHWKKSGQVVVCCKKN